MSPEISFVIPSWNAAAKLEPCLESLNAMSALAEVEAIFIDDGSTDHTASLLEDFCASRPWASLLRMPQNTGGPSAPRNAGIEQATGEYVFFLDIDDQLLPAGVFASLMLARKTGADVVRAPLVRHDARGDRTLNALPGWKPTLTHVQRVEMMIARQSTTVCGLIRRQLLLDHGIRWNAQYRMGEDTVFWVEVFSHARIIEYSPQPDFTYIVKASNAVKSSTQQYQDRELSDHLGVWRAVSKSLAPLGIDYFSLRGQVAIQSVFTALRRYNRGGVSRELFEDFAMLLKDHEAVVTSFPMNARNKEILRLLLEGDYSGFHEAIKLRLLIAGMDLKFIQPALPALREHFLVQVDQWTGHDAHDEPRSQRLLEWADVVHAEWMLGNAVWYSVNRRPGQKLIVRLHRFELTRDFGDRLDRSNLDRVICVSQPTLEDTQQRFGFDRSKLRMLPNFIDVEAYAESREPEKVFNLAIVGIVGSNKGYHRALELLAELRQLDPRYNLTVYGKLPHELPWVARDPKEGAYFAACERYIDDHSLRGAIHLAGWADTRTALADKGFVLSMSDFESFHVAPAEAFAAGNIGLFLPWRGVEYIHPNKYICRDVDEMRDRILAVQDLAAFDAEAAEGIGFVRENFSLERFVEDYAQLVMDVIDEHVAG